MDKGIIYRRDNYVCDGKEVIVLTNINNPEDCEYYISYSYQLPQMDKDKPAPHIPRQARMTDAKSVADVFDKFDIVAKADLKQVNDELRSIMQDARQKRDSKIAVPTIALPPGFDPKIIRGTGKGPV